MSVKFDMHCHTKEGSIDSKITIENYIQKLKSKGFSGMLITDHDSYNGYRAYKSTIKVRKHKDFVVLKGIEYDTIDAGHILVIMPENINLKLLEFRGLSVWALISIVHKYGGILGPAHPCGERHLSIFNTGVFRRYTKIAEKFDFLEGFNACEDAESNEKAQELARLYNKPLFGGSDAHREDCAGMGYTEFETEIKKESDLIKYIKRGKHTVAAGSRYYGTTKDKLGWANVFLVESFWFYNKFLGFTKKLKRHREIKKLVIKPK